MKKVTLRFFGMLAIGIITMFSANYLSAGSFAKVSSDSIINAGIETEEAIGELNFRNTTFNAVSFKVKMMFEEVAFGHQAAICTIYCYSFTDADWDGSDPQPLEGLQSTTEAFDDIPITVHCKTYGISGTTKLTYRFYNVADADDYIDFPVRFNIGLTSVDDNKDEQVFAYPNPTNNVLNVNAEKMIDNIKLYSIKGSEVFDQTNISNNSAALNLSSLSAGKYVMIITLSDGTQRKQSVIVE